MSAFDEVLGSPEWAFAFAAALEQELADDRILTVGSAAPSAAAALGDETTRSITLRFSTANGYRGSVTLDAVESFATRLQVAAGDDLISTPCAAAFEAATRTIGEQAVVAVVPEAGSPFEINSADDSAANNAANNDGVDEGFDVAVFPILDRGDVQGALTLRVSSGSQPGGPDVDQGATTDDAATDDAPVPRPKAPGPLAPSGAPYVLADVEMGVTAELGRCRMTMRELLAITPGAVIDLDRAAGAPVDVLVNGTLIARGEVVVVDEEFGIRISELVPQPAAH